VKPSIALFAPVSTLEPMYSITGVLLDQYNLLTRKGYSVRLIVKDDFKDRHLLPGADIRTVSSHYFSVEQHHSFDFEVEVNRLAEEMYHHLQDIDVCIAHDILFVEHYLHYNWAARQNMSNLPKLKWLHWIHSGPSFRDIHAEYPRNGLFLPPINSRMVYVNQTDIPRISKMYGLKDKDVKLVHNMIDPVRSFDFHPLAEEIYHRLEIYNTDVFCVYPARMCPGKQPEKLIKLVAAMKAYDRMVRLLMCNSYSNGDDEKQYISNLKATAKEHGLDESDLVFTSEFQSEWASSAKHEMGLGVPRKVISDLMRLSDIFILPSISEACSIIMLEAGLSKNMMVLNEDLDSFHEFGGRKIDNNTSANCIYVPFGSINRRTEKYHPSEEDWLLDQARFILECQSLDKSLQFFKKVRKCHSPDWIFENQLEPLLYA